MRVLSKLPNLLTFARICLTPILAASVAGQHYRAAFWWLVAAGVTDALDGWVARRFGGVSRLGALLDPLADKALLVAGYVALAMAGAVPAWLAVLVVGRDAAILLVAAVLLALGVRRRFPPSVWGKLSTFWQIFTGSFALGVRAFGVEALAPALPWLFVLTAAATGWSGLHYAWTAARWREEAEG
jgi:cardiolipin synthase